MGERIEDESLSVFDSSLKRVVRKMKPTHRDLFFIGLILRLRSQTPVWPYLKPSNIANPVSLNIVYNFQRMSQARLLRRRQSAIVRRVAAGPVLHCTSAVQTGGFGKLRVVVCKFGNHERLI